MRLITNEYAAQVEQAAIRLAAGMMADRNVSLDNHKQYEDVADQAIRLAMIVLDRADTKLSGQASYEPVKPEQLPNPHPNITQVSYGMTVNTGENQGVKFAFTAQVNANESWAFVYGQLKEQAAMEQRRILRGHDENKTRDEAL